MSKHQSRKTRWTRLNAKEYRSAFGVVRYRAGAWEGELHFELWHEPTPGEHLDLWTPQSVFAGRFKRPRNAMISVEDKAKETQRRYQEKAKVAWSE